MNTRLRKNALSDGVRYLGIDELTEYLSIGRGSAREVGKAAGAVVKIGKRVIYDKNKIDMYIESLAQ